MSSLTTTTVNTANGSTNLTLMTGNSSSASIVVRTDGTLSVKANSTVNTITINTSTITTNTATFLANGNFIANGVANLYSNTTVNASLTVANVLTVTNSAVFSTNSVTMGAASVANPGYTRLPNGLLLQWGNVSVTSTTGTITFPAAFSAVYSVQLTPSTNNSTHQPAVTALTTTTANVRSSNTTANTVYWMAIGS